MRKLWILLGLASTALATPAAARDGSAYIGLEAGVMKPRPLNLSYTEAGATIPNALRLTHKWGYDLDMVAGYDFGMFRLEGEFGYKHSSIKRATISPAAATATTGPGGSLDASGRARVLSAMLNALVDFGGPGISGSVGLGIGSADVRYRAITDTPTFLSFRSGDRAMAWQALAEVRKPISDAVDVGLKYRYFQTSKLHFGPFCQTTCGAVVGPYETRGKFRSHSLLASVIFNFGMAVAAPPPAPVEVAPPPPPPPATQTCPDGSVILATSSCPLPPPPPPPPVERGERGS